MGRLFETSENEYSRDLQGSLVTHTVLGG